jgi:hypothetical protein
MRAGGHLWRGAGKWISFPFIFFSRRRGRGPLGSWSRGRIAAARSPMPSSRPCPVAAAARSSPPWTRSWRLPGAGTATPLASLPQRPEPPAFSAPPPSSWLEEEGTPGPRAPSGAVPACGRAPPSSRRRLQGIGWDCQDNEWLGFVCLCLTRVRDWTLGRYFWAGRAGRKWTRKWASATCASGKGSALWPLGPPST